jgi:hypothetical protein
MYPHRIRLRGPWDCEPLGRVTMPCRWEHAGRVRCRRRFGYPGRIDEYERVWLTFAGAGGCVAVWLNGEELQTPEDASWPFEFDVTRLLLARNELVVEVEVPEGGRLWDDVVLEVRCTAFLRAVRVWISEEGRPELHAAGEVVGTAERPLDLYVIRERSTVAYTTVDATPEGRPFHLVAEGVCDAEGPVRVELVNGATVWYAWEGSV